MAGFRERARERIAGFMSHPVTDVTVIVLIITSVTLMLVETQLEAGHVRDTIELIGFGITVIFAIELTLRFVGETRKLRFFRSYWIDIIAVLPVFRAFRFLRILRFFRIFRLGLLLNRRISYVSRVFRDSLGEAVLVLVVLLILVLVGGMAIHMAESSHPSFNTFRESVWWSVLSLIGGEPIGGQPQTHLGRMVTVTVMLGGMVVFATLTGIVSAGMVSRMREGMRQKDAEIEALKDHVIICGWNRAGFTILEEFFCDPRFRGRSVVIIAEFEGPPDFGPKLQEPGRVFLVCGDYTIINTLQRANIQHASTAILLADKTISRSDQDRDARTVLAAMLIEKLRPDIFSCVELLNRDNEAHLRMLGVEEIVVLDDYGGSIIAAASQNKGMVPVFNELFTFSYGNRFLKEKVPRGLVSKDVLTAVSILKQKYNAVLIAVETTDDEGRRKNVVNPTADYELKADDRILVVTDRSHL